jgi:hypothetical protein
MQNTHQPSIEVRSGLPLIEPRQCALQSRLDNVVGRIPGPGQYACEAAQPWDQVDDLLMDVTQELSYLTRSRPFGRQITVEAMGLFRADTGFSILAYRAPRHDGLA